MLRFGEYVESRDSDAAERIAISKRNVSDTKFVEPGWEGETEIVGGAIHQKRSPSEVNRNLAQELAFAWEEQPHAEIEKELLAIPGVKKIGEKGESVSFVGRLHKGRGLFQDDPAIITRPGWLIIDEKGIPASQRAVKYILSKAEAIPKV